MRKFQLIKILDYNDFRKPVSRVYEIDGNELDSILDQVPEVGTKGYNVKWQLLNNGKATFRGESNVTVRLILKELKQVH
jgi:hypothetical protein